MFFIDLGAGLLVPWVLLSLAAMALSILICRHAMRLCAALRLLDIPDGRKLHKDPTPLMGGLALILSILPVGFVAILLGYSGSMTNTAALIVAATYAIALIGMADDRHSLSPRLRLLLTLLLFAVVAIIDGHLNVRFLSFTFLGFDLGTGGGIGSILFTTICCVGLVNAINMADGKNGLVIGMVLVWLAVLTAYAPTGLLPIVFIAIGGLIPLFFFNLRGSLFLGDGGAYGLACLVGLMVIATYNSGGGFDDRRIAAEHVVALFAVPVFDSFRLTISRMLKGRSPMSADRDHLHHHLQARFGWPLGLFIYWGLVLLPMAAIAVIY